MSIRFFDMFAGIGGFRSGLEAVGGFECIGHCEIDKYANQAYNAIYEPKGELFFEDARKINPKDLPDIDLICAGFPCQSFSIAGLRKGFKDDARGTLFFEIARIASVKRPSFLLLENVPGLLSHDKGRTFATILSTLDELGYDVTWQVLNSKNFGVPQSRKRVYIIGYLRSRCTGEILSFTEANRTPVIQVIPGTQGERVYSDSGVGITLTSGAGGFAGNTGLYNIGIPVKVKTKAGYQIAHPGDSIALAYPSLNSRRGRVGDNIAHTVTPGNTQGYFFIDMNENTKLTDTARWSAPHPVIQKLAQMYPDISFEHEWADEDIGHNCGRKCYSGGECTEKYYPESQKDGIEFACRIWDYDPTEFNLMLNKAENGYINIENDEYDLISLFGKPALFTNERLTDADIPKGLFCYHFREGDDGRLATVEPKVKVNHAGTVITDEPIDFGEQGYIVLTEDTEPNFMGEEMTFGEYMQDGMKAAGFNGRVKEAQVLYVLALSDFSNDSGFADKLVSCFTENQTDEQLISAVNSTFGTQLTAEDFSNVMGNIRSLHIDTSDYTDISTKNNIDLVKWATHAQESGWGYVYGTYGAVLDKSVFEFKKNQYPDEVGVHADFIRQNWLGRRTADCVGLIKGYGWYDTESGKINIGSNNMQDVSANGMFQAATEKGTIDTLPEIPGLAVWHEGHIGIYIGNGEVIQAAKLGCGVAKYRLGKMFLQGKDVPKNVDYALRWLEESALESNEFAEYLLGKTYLKGEDVKQDLIRAEELLQKSSAQGNKYAKYTLGKAYLDGELFMQNIPEAVTLITESADQDFASAQYLLGKLLYKGEVTPQDLEKSINYLEKAAEQKNPYAAYLSGKIRLTEDAVKDISKALRNFEIAAENGNDYAEYMLGKIYLYGKVVERDYDKAIVYLTASTEHGNQYAKQLLYSIKANRNWSVALSSLRLLSHISRMIQNRLEDERKGKQHSVDRKLRRKIDEKKQAHGLKQG